MRRSTREARTLAISAHAAAVAARAEADIAEVSNRDYSPAHYYAAERANTAEQEADRYWLRLARTMQGRG